MLTITSIYAALLALMFVVLSGRVILYRRVNRISLGDGGDAELQRRSRIQGNFAEYVPFGVVLIALCELGGAPGVVIHAMGTGLLVGRLLHAAALTQVPQNLTFRSLGMALTFVILISAAALLLAQALFR